MTFEELALLEHIIEDQRVLIYSVIWMIGWYIKHYTRINNAYIPHILLFVGVLLGLVLYELSFIGAFIGALIVFIQLGAYDVLSGFKKGMKAD